MKDKLKSLVLVNGISAVMFVMALLLIFFTDYLPIGIGASAVWLIYTVCANRYVLVEKKAPPLRETFQEGNVKGIFNNEVRMLEKQYDSIKSREEFMMSNTESMQELYGRILEQMNSNLDSASAYMKTYDYYTRPNPTYLTKLVHDGDMLVRKFNTLVEKLVDIDTNPTTLDVKYVDEVTECLEGMKEYKKVMVRM